jgi:hypothetical protein
MLYLPLTSYPTTKIIQQFSTFKQAIAFWSTIDKDYMSHIRQSTQSMEMLVSRRYPIGRFFKTYLERLWTHWTSKCMFFGIMQ